MNQFNDPENDKVLKANKDIEDVRVCFIRLIILYYTINYLNLLGYYA